MARRRNTAEQIISKLRDELLDREVFCTLTVAQVCKALEVTEQTYYRWRTEYGGMQVAQARRLKQLEGENTRLQRAIADLTVANQTLQDELLMVCV